MQRKLRARKSSYTGLVPVRIYLTFEGENAPWVVVHESIHGLAVTCLGCRTSFDIRRFDAELFGDQYVMGELLPHKDCVEAGMRTLALIDHNAQQIKQAKESSTEASSSVQAVDAETNQQSNEAVVP